MRKKCLEIDILAHQNTLLMCRLLKIEDNKDSLNEEIKMKRKKVKTQEKELKNQNRNKGKIKEDDCACKEKK